MPRPDRPDILLLMADQLAAAALPAYGNPVARVPHISALAERGAVFENCCTGFPLCAPARFSMLAGQRASSIAAWDNGAEFPAEVPTVAHCLRAAGYRTCLSGKMHFVGPDQLHGFEERITTDICPADFGWTADWDHPGKIQPWFHTMQFASEGGVAARTVQMDYDEESTHQTVRQIYQWGRERRSDRRPFFLLHSMTHPHDPYATTREYWDRYRDADIDMPAVPAILPEKRDAHSRRLYDNYDRGEYQMDERRIRNSRRGYYGNLAFVDDQIGKILAALSAAGLDDNLLIAFAADHGDMLGERGMWYKMSFYDWSVRVPMIVAWSGEIAPRRIRANASLFDLAPTLAEIGANGDPGNQLPECDGRSFAALLRGDDSQWPDIGISEYLCEATPAPYVMIRRGRHKYCKCDGDPPQLFDMESDPHELNDLAGEPEAAEVERAMEKTVAERWNFPELTARILRSQRRRRLVHRALTTGRVKSWDHQPFFDATRQYYRGTGSYQDIEKSDLLPYPDARGEI